MNYIEKHGILERFELYDRHSIPHECESSLEKIARLADIVIDLEEQITLLSAGTVVRWRLVYRDPPEPDCRIIAWAEGWKDWAILHYLSDVEGTWWFREGSCYEPESEPLIEEDGDIFPTHWTEINKPST